MIKRFNTHKQWKNIIAIEKLEVQLALVVSALMVGLLLLLNVFDNFVTFKDALQSMVSGFLAGFIALLGFALSAVAVVASLFNKADVKKLERHSPGGIEGMLASFEYLGFVTAATVAILCIAYITMEIDWPFHVSLFYLAAFIVMYFVFFTMFYTVSLAGNCVRLYTFKLEE